MNNEVTAEEAAYILNSPIFDSEVFVDMLVWVIREYAEGRIVAAETGG